MKPTSKKPDWISEVEAAALMGYQPKVFRRYARSGKLSINYTRVNHRTYEYNKNDIDEWKIQHSTIAA